jgi:polyketide-type polyunsaturated fatty acid synthase PfaA
MSPIGLFDALEQLQYQVVDFEKTVVQLIRAKKMISRKPAQTEQAQTQRINRQLRHKPIAIVGIASIFPQANNLQQYWENILNEVDCITEVPASRWKVDDYFDPDPRAVDKTYCKRGGFVSDVDFNPMEFGLPPNLLEVTDISQLLSLVVAKQALEDSGYGESSDFDREQAGITLGVTVGRQLTSPLNARMQYPIWERVLKNSGLSDSETQAIVEKIKLAYVEWNENAFPGMLGNVVAGRIANRLNLGGTNCTLDAACASSLAAFKMAISELTEYRANLMITGGVDTDNSILTYLCFSKTPALSRSQQSRPFDADSDGILLGEGLGMMVLKRLEDAEKDGDRIYAVIKGIGTSSDGRFKSIYAPRAEGQVKALERAYEDAGFEPGSLGLIEAHGTGTVAGDSTEFEALNQFFSAHNIQKQSIALGSVKSQIGHTKAAAGAASLIKAALALHHKILPPTINVVKPNPKLDIENSPFYLNTKARPWIRAAEATPRRAGVSSFGFGGTNFHILLEEYDEGQNRLDQSVRPYRIHRVSESIVLTAGTPSGLLSECQKILQQFQSEQGELLYPGFIEAWKSVEIPEESARMGFTADSLEETCHKLDIAINWLEKQPQLTEWDHPKGIYFRADGLNLKGKVVALFSGQGSQYPEMGRELAMNFPELRLAYSAVDGLFLKDGVASVSEAVFPAPAFDDAARTAQSEALRRTDYAQPAIGALSVGLFRILEKAGFTADFAAGHSFGELTALWAAQVLSDEDYFALVKARGQAMAGSHLPNGADASSGDAGAMLAVKLAVSEVEVAIQDFPQVAIANVNAPQQVVLAGTRSAILEIQEQFQSQGTLATLLPVAAAFHTPLVAHAQKPFAKAIESVTFNAPQLPVYTNVTGQRYPEEPAAIQKILKDHLLNRVQFKQEIENIYAEGGYCFIEFGPKATLTNLVKEILGDSPHIAVALNASAKQDSDRQLRDAVLQLRVAGLVLGNIDTYALAPVIPPQIEKNKALAVKLGGNNYISEKSKNAFEAALQNGQCLKPPLEHEFATLAESTDLRSPATEPLPMTSFSLEPRHLEASITLSALAPNQPIPEVEPQLMSDISDISLNAPQLFQTLEYSLGQLNQHQSETLQVHSQYLSHQMEYAKIFFQLMQQKGTLFSENAKAPVGSNSDAQLAVLQSLERGMEHFHNHQTHTLRVHEQSLQHQTEYASNLFHLAQQHYQVLLGNGLSLQENVAASAASPIVQNEYHAPLSEERPVVPSRMQQPAAPAPAVVVTKVSELSDLQHRNGSGTAESQPALQNGTILVSKSASESVQPVPAIADDSLSQPSPTPQPVKAKVAAANTVERSELQPILLAIVSEKTGYPVEMLELEMDMEADLGIDSIKRVEILGALQEHYPNSPQPNLEDLAELRTLAQIAIYMVQLSSRSIVTEAEAALAISAEPTPSKARPVKVLAEAKSNGATNRTHNGHNGSGMTPAIASRNGHYNGGSTAVATAPPPMQNPALAATATLADLDRQLDRSPPLDPVPARQPTPLTTELIEPMDIHTLSQTLIEVVSEKTGYPAEMLELEMDMEADLGIDSIKRVEILGAMQERFATLPQPNLEDLAELRTLAQIVSFLGQSAPEKKKLAPTLTPELMTSNLS